MINYIDYDKKEVHIPDYIPLHELAIFLDTNYPYLHDFKIMIDGGTDESPDTEQKDDIPY